MVFPRKCVVTSRVIYPSRGGLGIEVVGTIQTETKQLIPEQLKFKSTLQLPDCCSFLTGCSSTREKTADSKISKQGKPKIRTCWDLPTTDGDVQIHLSIGKAQAKITKEPFRGDSLNGGHAKEKQRVFTQEWVMEGEAHTASPEVCQTCLVEIKEDSFQCCRLTACSKCRHRRPVRKMDSIISHEHQHCRSTVHCPHTIPPGKNPEVLTHSTCIRCTHTLMVELGKLMTTSRAFPRSSHVHPTSLWRQPHLHLCP